MSITKIPAEWSIAMLQTVTGISRVTILQRLAKIQPLRITGKMRTYAAPECFRAIIKTHKGGDALDRLNTAKAVAAERTNRREVGELIEKNIVETTWENVLVLFRDRMRKVGNNVQSKTNLNVQQRSALEREIADSLEHLSKKLIYCAASNADNEAD